MNLEIALGLFGAAATATNLLNAWMTNRVRMEITTLKLEVSERREKDREWLEDKFMLRSEIEGRFKTMEAKMGMKIFT